MYYVGHSDDPWRRLSEHNFSEHTTYTSKHRPWKLAAVFLCSESRADALRIEKFIKHQKSRKLIEAMISDKPLVGDLAQLPAGRQAGLESRTCGKGPNVKLTLIRRGCLTSGLPALS